MIDGNTTKKMRTCEQVALNSKNDYFISDCAASKAVTYNYHKEK